MMTLRIRSLMLFAAVAVTTTACKKKPAETPAPTTTPSTPAPPPVTPPPASSNTPPATNNNDAEAARRAIEAVKNTITATIYFDYDKSELLPDARRILDEKVPLLRANSAVRIRVVGHTDERGSDEYNQALGQRRAAAARTYLSAAGIEGSRIDVVSMGESQPAMMGEGEASWSKNRRDEFQIVAGADQIRAPGR